MRNRLHLLLAASALTLLTGCTIIPDMIVAMDEADEKARHELTARNRAIGTANHAALRDEEFVAALQRAFPNSAALRQERDRRLALVEAAAGKAPVEALRVAELQVNLLGLGEATEAESLALCTRMSDLALAGAGKNDELRVRVAHLWAGGWILPRDARRVAAALRDVTTDEAVSNPTFAENLAGAAWYFPAQDPACADAFDTPAFRDQLEEHSQRLDPDHWRSDVKPGVYGLYPLPYYTENHPVYAATRGRAETTRALAEAIRTGGSPDPATRLESVATAFRLGLNPPLTRGVDKKYTGWATPELTPTFDTPAARRYLDALFAAEKAGHPRAMFLLAVFSNRDADNPRLPLQSRPELAATTGRLARAAALGEPNAQSLLGEWLYTGDGLPHDVPRAIALWSAAAKAGDARASALLAACIAKKMPGHELATAQQ